MSGGFAGKESRSAGFKAASLPELTAREGDGQLFHPHSELITREGPLLTSTLVRMDGELVFSSAAALDSGSEAPPPSPPAACLPVLGAGGVLAHRATSWSDPAGLGAPGDDRKAPWVEDSGGSGTGPQLGWGVGAKGQTQPLSGAVFLGAGLGRHTGPTPRFWSIAHPTAPPAGQGTAGLSCCLTVKGTGEHAPLQGPLVGFSPKGREAGDPTPPGGSCGLSQRSLLPVSCPCPPSPVRTSPSWRRSWALAPEGPGNSGV